MVPSFEETGRSLRTKSAASSTSPRSCSVRIVSRPDLIPDWAGIEQDAAAPGGTVRGGVTAGNRRKIWGFSAAGLALALLLAAFISPLASSAPDGLEKVAQQQQFLQLAEGREVWHGSLLPDYTVPAVEAEEVSTGVAGLLGTIVMFAVGYVVVKLLSMRSAKQES